MSAKEKKKKGIPLFRSFSSSKSEQTQRIWSRTHLNMEGRKISHPTEGGKKKTTFWVFFLPEQRQKAKDLKVRLTAAEL